MREPHLPLTTTVAGCWGIQYQSELLQLLKKNSPVCIIANYRSFSLLVWFSHPKLKF